jgi:hypothetical protein
MEPNPGIDAVRQLSLIGYSFMVNGRAIKAKYGGPGKPDPAQIRPLLALVRENKAELIDYLARKLQAPPEGILTCADCPHFEANHGPNPRQGWGKCLRRGRGRYGSATACEAALDFKGDNELEHVTIT